MKKLGAHCTLLLILAACGGAIPDQKTPLSGAVHSFDCSNTGGSLRWVLIRYDESDVFEAGLYGDARFQWLYRTREPAAIFTENRVQFENKSVFIDDRLAFNLTRDAADPSGAMVGTVTTAANMLHKPTALPARCQPMTRGTPLGLIRDLTILPPATRIKIKKRLELDLGKSVLVGELHVNSKTRAYCELSRPSSEGSLAKTVVEPGDRTIGDEAGSNVGSTVLGTGLNQLFGGAHWNLDASPSPLSLSCTREIIDSSLPTQYDSLTPDELRATLASLDAIEIL